MKRVYPKAEVCIACGLCQVHCRVAHSQTRDIIKAYKEEKPQQLSRIKLQKQDGLSFGLNCRQCAEPLCVYSCLTGAMHRDAKTGVISVDTEKCVGCWTCVLVCPYGAVTPDFVQKKAVKCDLCPGLPVPACVANCPNEALVYAEAAPGRETLSTKS